jgi:hypothetical protein
MPVKSFFVWDEFMTVRRMKTYTGGQGYVYQYYFVGQRPGAAGKDKAIEYVFDVTADRKTMFSVSVLVREDALASWAVEHGRRLTEAEQYGAAKMRLFRGFDEVEHMQRDGRTLLLDSAGLREVLTTLGVE